MKTIGALGLAALLVACFCAATAAGAAGPLRLVDAPAGWVRSDETPAPATSPCGAVAVRPLIERVSRFEDPAGPAALRSTWRVYATPKRARAALAELRALLATCTSYTTSRSDGTPVTVTVERAAFPPLGEESVAYLRTFELGTTTPGAYTIVARVKRRVASLTIIDGDIPSPDLALLLARRAVRRA